MKRVALICNFPWVGISTSVINTALIWDSVGYFVDVFCEKPDIIRFPLPKYNNRSINYIITNINKRIIFGDYYFRKSYFIEKDYEWAIGFDYSGVIRAGIACLGTKTKLIYHSLEFFEPDSSNYKNKVIKFLETTFAGRAEFIFTQDEYRKKFLAKDLKQPVERFKIVYNSPIGDVIKESSNYFRTLFNIPENKKIVLCVGSLISEHYLIELVESVETWSEEFVLILHGWFPVKSIKEFVFSNKMKCPGRIFTSEQLFSTFEKHIPFIACDIGFVGFKPIDNNTIYAAGAAGKIFDFMRAGKPILALDTPGMSEIIKTDLGIIFSEKEKIKDSLIKILQNYNNYSQNCFEQFNAYEFSCQYRSILKFII